MQAEDAVAFVYQRFDGFKSFSGNGKLAFKRPRKL